MKKTLLSLVTLTLLSCSKAGPGTAVVTDPKPKTGVNDGDAQSNPLFENAKVVDDIADYTAGKLSIDASNVSTAKLFAVLTPLDSTSSADELSASFPRPILNRICGAIAFQNSQPASLIWRAHLDLADQAEVGQLLLAFNASLSCVAELDAETKFGFDLKTSPTTNCCYSSAQWEKLAGKTVLVPSKTLQTGARVEVTPQSNIATGVAVAPNSAIVLENVDGHCAFKTPVLPSEPNKKITMRYKVSAGSLVSIEHATTLPECKSIAASIKDGLSIEGTCEQFAPLYALPQLCAFRATLDSAGSKSEVAVRLSLPPRETLGDSKTPPQCTSGTTRCSGTTEQVCAADGYSWLDADTQSKKCGFQPKFCSAGMERCFNGDLQVCNNSETAFTTRQAKAFQCGVFPPQVCVAGQTRCNASTKEECAPSGYAWNMVELQSTECGASPQACVANQENCFGTTRFACKTDGSGFEPREYNSRMCGYVPPAPQAKICEEGWKGCWSDLSYRECSTDGNSWKVNIANDNRCKPAGTVNIDESECKYLSTRCVGYNFHQCLRGTDKTYWKDQGYVVKVGDQGFPCGKKPDPTPGPVPTIDPTTVTTPPPDAGLPPRNSVVPRHPNNPAESRIKYRYFDKDFNRWGAIAEAFDLLLYVTNYNQYYSHLQYIDWGGTANGNCAKGNVGGFARNGENFFTWCLNGDLQAEKVANAVRDNYIVYRSVLIIHESLHTLGRKHDREEPSYAPCTGSGFAAGVPVQIKQCTESYCAGLKDQAMHMFLMELNYSVADGRRFQGQCQQWSAIMGATP